METQEAPLSKQRLAQARCQDARIGVDLGIEIRAAAKPFDRDGIGLERRSAPRRAGFDKILEHSHQRGRANECRILEQSVEFCKHHNRIAHGAIQFTVHMISRAHRCVWSSLLPPPAPPASGATTGLKIQCRKYPKWQRYLRRAGGSPQRRPCAGNEAAMIQELAPPLVRIGWRGQAGGNFSCCGFIRAAGTGVTSGETVSNFRTARSAWSMPRTSPALRPGPAKKNAISGARLATCRSRPSACRPCADHRPTPPLDQADHCPAAAGNARV